MQSFRDNQGRTWAIDVNVDAVKRVRQLLDVDLLKAAEGELLAKLAGDPVMLVDVIYAICKPEVDRQDITNEDFGRAMAGDAIERATEALLEGLVDFFPNPKRAPLKKALGKLRTLEALALTRANRMLDSDRMEKAMETELTRVEEDFGKRFGGSLESSESPPAP